LLVDKLNTDAEIEEIQAEVDDLKAQNNADAAAVDEIFAEKQEKEKVIRALEAEIEQERNLADNLIGSMDNRVREEYAHLQTTNSTLLSRFEALQQEMDAVNARKAQLEGELSISHVKQDAVKLYEQLAEIEEEYQRVLAEDAVRGTPAQERDRLLKQVKEDNAEIAAMERQATEMNDEIKVGLDLIK
jgi:intraflagellar transport protein 74